MPFPWLFLSLYFPWVILPPRMLHLLILGTKWTQRWLKWNKERASFSFKSWDSLPVPAAEVLSAASPGVHTRPVGSERRKAEGGKRSQIYFTLLICKDFENSYDFFLSCQMSKQRSELKPYRGPIIRLPTHLPHTPSRPATHRPKGHWESEPSLIIVDWVRSPKSQKEEFRRRGSAATVGDLQPFTWELPKQE